MKGSDLSPRNPIFKQMLSPRDNNPHNMSQPLIQSPSKKPKPPISKMSPTSFRCLSSANFSNNSSSNSSTFNSRESAQTSARSIQFENEKIQVYLRIRPPLPNEKTFPYTVDNKTITLQPRNNFLSSQGIEKAFSFKQIMDNTTTQVEVFEQVALPLIPSFLEGDDVLIFCYGSTNAGKTFTVSGTQQNPGILRRSLECIVTKLFYESNEENAAPNSDTPINKSNSSKGPQLVASFVEIYNERIYDLLNIQKNAESLKLGVNSEGETEIKGTVEIPINSLEEVKTVVQKAEAGRHKGFTELNCDSSRSHTVFQLKVKRKNIHSTFSIVDLAGSERLSSINSTKGSFKEACNINKSMLALGKCIRYLKMQSQSPAKCTQVPYRESKLTHIFKNFFEPTLRPSKAAMIINISPSILQIDDTLFAMQFAASASLCTIKHVEKQEIVESDESEEEEPEVVNPPPEPKETTEEIEARIEKKLRDEMDEYFIKLEKEFKDHYEKVNNINQTILDTRKNFMDKQLELMQKQQEHEKQKNQELTKQKINHQKKIKKKIKKVTVEKQSPDAPQLARNKEQIAELQKTLNNIIQQNAKLQNENEALASKINEAKEKLKDSEVINKKISSQNDEMKKTIANIEAKSDEYSQTILYETQSVIHKPLSEYEINSVIQLPPAISFSATKEQSQTEKSDVNNQELEKNQNSNYHPVRRVLIPPPK